MAHITSIANTANGELVASECGHRFYVHPDTKSYLGMVVPEHINNHEDALIVCECCKCGTAYVTHRQVADNCPNCTHFAALLVGEDEIDWVSFSHLHSLYGCYSVRAQILSPVGELVWEYDALKDDDEIVDEDVIFNWLQDVTFEAKKQANSFGLTPADGSKIRIALAPFFRESEGRVLDAWRDTGWYGYTWKWNGKDIDEAEMHGCCKSIYGYCEDLEDFVELVSEWGKYTEDLCWLGKLD